ncbi:DksA C4-type domain-containing protein [Halomonas sp. NYA30]
MRKHEDNSLPNDELEAPEENKCDYCGEYPPVQYVGGQAICEDCLEDN